MKKFRDLNILINFFNLYLKDTLFYRAFNTDSENI